MGCRVCPDLAGLCRELEAGAGAAVLTEEALGRAEFGQLVEALGRQPAWSDFPVLVLTRAGADSEVVLRTLETLGNVTLLERPVRVPALVSAVRTALRARRRQYQIRDHLAEQQRTAEALRQADRRRTSSWPCWPTSSATRWPRSATALHILNGPTPAARRPAGSGT